MVGGSLTFIFARSARAGDGRARDAVDESIGVAVDDETTAGTEVDLIILARFAVRSATEVIIGSAEGNDCAVFANGCLLRFDPDGRLERRVPMPVKYPTMPAFGGPDGRTLFVTSANWPIDPAERDKHPLEGGLFATEAPVAGRPAHFYDPSR